MSSDTPRTDAWEKAHAHYIWPVQYDFMLALAETLERELTAAQARIAELEAQAKADAEAIENAIGQGIGNATHEYMDDCCGRTLDEVAEKIYAAIDATRERGNG